MQDSPIPTYKVALIGTGGVGKTSFVKALAGEPFSGCYIATLGVDVQPIRIPGVNACFNIWDCAGDPKFMGLGEGYYKESHACIVMFDMTSPQSLVRSAEMIQGFRNVCPEAPIYYVANKCDASTYECPAPAFLCSSKERRDCESVLIQIANDLQGENVLATKTFSTCKL